MPPSSALVGSTRRPGTTLDSWFSLRMTALLARAGLTMNGPHPWDPQIQNRRAIRRVLFRGTRGAGEAYVDGDWECEALDEFTARLLAARADAPLKRRVPALLDILKGRLANRQTRVRARAGIAAHYDIGNDLYAAMLGSRMTYSCGYWPAAQTLDEAQDAKHALICHKLHLQPGARVLDIGCGWGGFAKYAAEHHDVEVVGITISSAQAAEARRRTAGLPVEIREDDYRDLHGTFDYVVSIGMFEHVGPANYRTFFRTVARVLKPSGLLLLHTIGGSSSAQASDPWINRYVFAESVLPSAALITRAFESLFVLEDWHNLSVNYDRTLMAWHANFESAWSRLSNRYSERFRRLWRYYLLTCAGTFRARRNNLWQLVLSPRGARGGYHRVSE